MFRVKYNKRLKSSSTISYILNNDYHRLDGPAVEMKSDDFSTIFWYKYGKRHREDGPAILNGVTKRWYIEGQEYTQEQWERWEDVEKCLK